MAKQQQESHEHGVGFLVHKDIVNTVIGCRPVSSRLITIRLREVLFNITIVQAYAPPSDYDDNKQPDHTGSVAARANKDRTFRRGFLFIRSGQNHLARHSERGKKARQTEEEVVR